MNLQQIYLANPEDLPEKWAEAWNQRDAVALANLFTEDAEFVNVVGLWWHNREAIWKAHEYGLRMIFNESYLTIRKTTRKDIATDVAIVHSRMKLTGQTSIGGIKQPADRMNVFSFVMKKEDKGWVCVSAHNTDIIPGMETNIVNEKGEMRSVDYRK